MKKDKNNYEIKIIFEKSRGWLCKQMLYFCIFLYYTENGRNVA